MFILIFIIILLALVYLRRQQSQPLLFIHIPKNAGTTIEEIALKCNVKWGRYMLTKHNPGEIPEWHVPPRFFSVENNPYHNKDTFCVIRNPFDRLQSHFKWLYRDNAKQFTSKQFNTWLSDNLNEHNVFEKGGHDGHLYPQSYYVYDKNHKRTCKHILRFDNLIEDFNVLIDTYKHVGVHHITHSMHYNNSVDTQFTITNENIHRILQLYRDDFILYDTISYKSAKIPKKIHKIYIQQDNTFGNMSSEIRDAHDTWKEQNYDYEIKYYNGNDCKQYLLKHFTPTHVQTYDNIRAYSGKCDFMRACIVYNEGGWYTDWKTTCLKPLDELVRNKECIEWVSAYDRPKLHEQYGRTFMMTNFFGAAIHHPVLNEYIRNIMLNVQHKHYGDSPLDATATGVLGKSFDLVKPYMNRKRMLIGQFYDNFKTHFNNEPWVLGKCDKCTKDQTWVNGNNYIKLWNERKYYI